MRRRVLLSLPVAALLLALTGPGPWLPGAFELAWLPVAPQAAVRTVPDYERGPHTTAHAAILYERSTGTVLYGKDIHERRAPASLTKVMTALVAIERGNMNDVVTVSRNAASIRGSSAHLYPDQKIRMIDLLHGLLLNSGNDAAVAIAEHIAGSVEAFVTLMNERARELGLVNTQFKNPHGLDEPGHYSSAFDLAVLTDTAMHYPLFAEIVAKREYTSEHRTFRNTNKLLWSMQGVEGVKTGTTGQAGNCLVAAISGEGMQLISVVLGSADRWNDSVRLLQHGFSGFQRLTVVERGAVLAEFDLPSAMQPIVAVAERPVAVVVRSDRPAEINVRTVLDGLRLPVRAGQRIGTVEVSVAPSGETLSIPLIAQGNVVRRTPLRALWRWLSSLF